MGVPVLAHEPEAAPLGHEALLGERFRKRLEQRERAQFCARGQRVTRVWRLGFGVQVVRQRDAVVARHLLDLPRKKVVRFACIQSLKNLKFWSERWLQERNPNDLGVATNADWFVADRTYSLSILRFRRSI